MKTELKKQKEIKENNERLKSLEIKRKKIQNELARKNLQRYKGISKEVIKAENQRKKYKLKGNKLRNKNDNKIHRQFKADDKMAQEKSRTA